MALSRLFFNDPLLTRDPFDDFVTSSPWALLAPTGTAAGNTQDLTLRDLAPHMRLDVKESDTGYEVRADVPGMNKEDLHVEMEGGVLRISGERKEEKREENERWHVQERRWGTVTRAVRLPKAADAEDVKASYKDGVLCVHVGRKAQEAKKTKAITIE